jgi:hypothetical protein
VVHPVQARPEHRQGVAPLAARSINSVNSVR